MGPKKEKPVNVSASLSPDEFQPVAFESQNLSTIALLLRSDEEEIIIKSLLAVLKYIEKSDKNKVDVKDLGILQVIYPHLQHSNRSIIKYACMNCAVLATSVEIRLEMKKLNFVSVLVNLLREDHDAGIYEYATLTLNHMAVDYYGRHLILKMNGVQLLNKMFTIPDPDVQKNSVNLLLLLLRNVHTLRQFEKTGGLPLLLDLLKSEHEVIQKSVILCLARISERGKLRSIFLHTGGLALLFQFLIQKTLPDFQADTLNILVNCLKDKECEQFLTDRGFLDIVMDMLKSNDLSEVKLFALKALMKLVKNVNIVKMLKSEDMHKLLVDCLYSDIVAIQSSASEVIALIAETRYWKNAVQEAGGIPGLVKLMQTSTEHQVQLNAVNALCNITYSSIKNCQDVLDLDGVDTLVSMLFCDNFELQAAAAACLTNLAIHHAVRERATTINVMVGFLKCLQSRDLDVQINTCTAIAAYACDEPARGQLLSEGLAPIVKLLSISKPEIYLKALWIISSIGVYPRIAIALCEQGIINFLCKNVKWSHRENFADLIMDRILNTHLPAKYGYVGRLSPQDHILDIFFDVGQWSWENKFPNLQELILEPIALGDLVYLINFTTNISIATIEQDDETEVISSTFQPTRDPVLLSYLREVETDIKMIENLREQISTLAIFVCKHMGGKFTMEEVNKFINDLEVSQLKARYMSNVIPIGSFKRGLYRPRALLFKAFSDYIGLPCSLVRGTYSRAWNEVWLTDKNYLEEDGYAKTEAYIVDLVFNPGKLLSLESLEATQYCGI